MLEHFQKFADYNKWANTVLFEAVGALENAQFHKDLGAFFGSISGTLNHLLVGDLLWMQRLEGSGPQPASLDTVLFESFENLQAARVDADLRLINLVNNLGTSNFEEIVHYKTMAGVPSQDPKSEILTHIFNHQTHHRAQCHQMLSQLGKEPPPLDMIYFFRNRS